MCVHGDFSPPEEESLTRSEISFDSAQFFFERMWKNVLTKKDRLMYSVHQGETSMLVRLFSSQTRVELLEFFLSRPDRRFYVREIVRELQRDISGIKRELDNLERVGLLTSSKVGNLRYYGVERSFPLYAELKAIIDKTRGIPQAIGEALRGIAGIRVAFVFGDHEAPERGAIDLLVVGRAHMAQLNRVVADLELRLGRSINYLVFDEGEYQRRKAEGDPFVREVLQGRTVLLIGSAHDL